MRIYLARRARWIIACARPDELKMALKGDTVNIKTADDDKARVEIEGKFGLKAKKLENGLSLLVEGGDKFIPRLFERIDTEILSVNLKKPSLEDVFINLTGRNIRDNGAPARYRGA